MVQFTHPQMFYLFIPFGLFIFWNIFISKRMEKQRNSLGNSKIVKFLFNRALFSRINFKSRLLILATFFLILASVGPQIGTKLTELKRKGVDVIIALDTSSSMDAIDIKPSRIEKAKSELSRLINNLKGDRIGLIVFAGTSHLHCPLTSDYSAARLFLNMIDTDIISAKGTDVSSAIELALENVKPEEEKFKIIILISDGEDHQGRAIEMAKKAKENNIIIHAIGVGTLSGGPIPVLDEQDNRIGFKKDRNGSVVTTTLNDAVLNEIAFTTGGTYIRVENQANAIGPLINEISSMEKRELKSHIFSQYEDRYQIFLILAFICLITEFLIPTRSKKEQVWEGRFLSGKESL